MNLTDQKGNRTQLKVVRISNSVDTPIIIGTETEYGISIKNAVEQDPVAASALVVNVYKDSNLKKITWDYQQETPFIDARGGIISGGENQTPDEDENTIINDVLFNGGRYYVDHAHPEYCTPECTNARDVVTYEKACLLYTSPSPRD